MKITKHETLLIFEDYLKDLTAEDLADICFEIDQIEKAEYQLREIILWNMKKEKMLDELVDAWGYEEVEKRLKEMRES